VRHACSGVPVIDRTVRQLYATGYLHNHARLWLASYLVHVLKVHWRTGADWLYSQLLCGDQASNFQFEPCASAPVSPLAIALSP
jgi:deoxyribodipyrimidine photo-lyase